jgi:hypothetical protein
MIVFALLLSSGETDEAEDERNEVIFAVTLQRRPFHARRVDTVHVLFAASKQGD